MSIVSRFFQFLSKTDRRVIIYCTDDSVKTQVSNGVFVLLTGTLAFLSSMYAVYATFEDFRVAIPVALIYATIIVFIDREIVSAGSRWATASRVLLAGVIGLVISVPLEMRLFKKRIDNQLIAENNDKNKAAREQMEADERDYEGRINTLENEIAAYRKNINEAGLDKQNEITGTVREGRGTGKPGPGSAWRAAEDQKQLNEQLLGETQAQLNTLKQEQSAVLARLKEIYNGHALPKDDDFMARYEAMEHVKASSPSALYIDWGIRALIMMLEMFPALMKLMQQRNEYNVAVKAARRVNITRTVAIANDQIDRLTQDPRTTPRPTLLEQLRENPFSS